MRDKKSGNFTYVRAEYCSGGDLEEIVRNAGLLDINTVRVMFLQMCYALYSCREQFQLRHFDLKLLNFLATDTTSLLWSHSESNNLQYLNQVKCNEILIDA